jgi:hypothetical protein
MPDEKPISFFPNFLSGLTADFYIFCVYIIRQEGIFTPSLPIPHQDNHGALVLQYRSSIKYQRNTFQTHTGWIIKKKQQDVNKARIFYLS